MRPPTGKTIASVTVALALALTPALAGCGDDDDAATTTTEAVESTTTTEAATEPVVDGAWARTSPMATDRGAAYFVITSPIDDRLVGASVDAAIAAKAEVHETVEVTDGAGSTMGSQGDEGMGSTSTMGSQGDAGMGNLEMREVEYIELPAGEPVELEPGGYHIMFIDLVAPLETGQTFDLTLELEEYGDLVVEVEVREG